MPEDYLAGLFTDAPPSNARKDARIFARETEGNASSLPWNWMTRITYADERMLRTLGMTTNDKK
jgi:hypothetical protein